MGGIGPALASGCRAGNSGGRETPRCDRPRLHKRNSVLLHRRDPKRQFVEQTATSQSHLPLRTLSGKLPQVVQKLPHPLDRRPHDAIVRLDTVRVGENTLTESTKDRLIAAFLTITAARGLDQATMREVAKEAGVSVGSVQYYGRTKDDLLLIVHQHLVDRIIARGETVPRRGPVGSVIRAFAHQFLPLDEIRATEQRVYLAFAARAAVTPALARIQHDLTSRLRTDCAAAFRSPMTGARPAATSTRRPSPGRSWRSSTASCSTC